MSSLSSVRIGPELCTLGAHLGMLGAHLGTGLGALRTELFEDSIKGRVDGGHPIVMPFVGPPDGTGLGSVLTFSANSGRITLQLAYLSVASERTRGIG